MSQSELRNLKLFVKTAELGSLRRAAAAEGISPQAASQALAQLEQKLGARLFHRTTRNMSLTDEGRLFMDAALPALQGLERAFQVVRQARDEVAGPLRIVGPRSSFQPVIGALVDEFCRRHPDAQPDVQLDDRIGNWVEDRVDVGFRVGSAPADGVIARRLFALQLILCAAPAYLKRHGAPSTLAELAGHRCSGFRHPSTGRLLPWHVKVDGNTVEQEVLPAFCTNEEGLEMEAVLAGRVIGQLSGIMAAAHLRAGRLVPVLAAHTADQYGLHIYWGSRVAQPARVRAFIDLAIERLSGNSDYVLGEQELARLELQGRRQHLRPIA
ncbi:LysR family transcriptional regulator [Mitsuaria sp. WAJ17]|uniref:LysR family transcriptional regulator n=1 Tax=Mitsuaria sp. WAJ17 TaxID=2761452 RepID=UPI0016038CE9|nr:LysR family transcriptional regulator [Mitsuaria sp. WAJ17]MBB2484571.1 LysR family transcriptional regulator [Mitsuaria sp. WAJ17]